MIDANNPALIWVGSLGAWLLCEVPLYSLSYSASFDTYRLDGALSFEVFALSVEDLMHAHDTSIATVRFRVPNGSAMVTYEMPGPWRIMSCRVQVGRLYGRTVILDMQRRLDDVFLISAT